VQRGDGVDVAVTDEPRRGQRVEPEPGQRDRGGRHQRGPQPPIVRGPAAVEPHEHAERHREVRGRVEDVGGAGQPGEPDQSTVQAEFDIQPQGAFEGEDVSGVAERRSRAGRAQDQPRERVRGVEHGHQQNFPPQRRRMTVDAGHENRPVPASAPYEAATGGLGGELGHMSILCTIQVFVITSPDGLRLSLEAYVSRRDHAREGTGP
jgi:hypothetical protein